MSVLLVDVTDLATNEAQPFQAEGRETNLRCPRIIKACIRLKIHVQALRKGFQTLDALRSFVEGRCPRDEQVESRKSSRIHFINELSQCVKTLVTRIAAHALNSLDFIKYQQKARMSRVTQDNEYALEEV